MIPPQGYSKYIEVIGEGQYLDMVYQYVAHLDLVMRVPKDSGELPDLRPLVGRCVESLLGAGIERQEINDGGVDIRRPWFQQKKSVHEAGCRLILSCGDWERLSKALHEVDSIPQVDNESIEVTMRRPVYENNAERKNQARRDAIAHAASHARVLAEKAGISFGQVISIEELGAAKYSPSGEDPRSPSAYHYRVESPASDERVRPETAQRTIWLRYVVRFAIV